MQTVLAELRTVAEGIDPLQVETACKMIADAGRIMLYGCGREGLQIQGFAMRLHHLGKLVSMQAICMHMYVYHARTYTNTHTPPTHTHSYRHTCDPPLTPRLFGVLFLGFCVGGGVLGLWGLVVGVWVCC